MKSLLALIVALGSWAGAAAFAADPPFEITSEQVSTGRNFANRIKFWAKSNEDFAICIKLITAEADNVEGGPVADVIRLEPHVEKLLVAQYDRIDVERSGSASVRIADVKPCD